MTCFLKFPDSVSLLYFYLGLFSPLSPLSLVCSVKALLQHLLLRLSFKSSWGLAFSRLIRSPWGPVPLPPLPSDGQVPLVLAVLSWPVELQWNTLYFLELCSQVFNINFVSLWFLLQRYWKFADLLLICSHLLLFGGYEVTLSPCFVVSLYCEFYFCIWLSFVFYVMIQGESQTSQPLAASSQ